MFEYKVKEQNEEFDKIVIEKSNITADFTIGDMKSEQLALLKYLKEFKANRDYKQVVMDNVASHHEYVTKFTDEELFTIAMYHEAKDKVKQYGDKIEEFEKQLKSSEEELAHVKKELNLVEHIVLDPEFLKPETNGEENK
jgi:predicted  nucleic acid-binding Zn-ribbon protein